MKTLRADFAAGLSLLTRLPTRWLAYDDTEYDLARSAWCWPAIGGAMGAATAGVFVSLAALGVPALVAAGWAIAFQLAATGALHEDGLADSADGFFGGHNAARRLKIMRDSRIGSYGTLALGVVLIVRTGAMVTLADTPFKLVAALMTAGAFSRLALMLPLLWLKPARTEGLAHQLRHLPARSLLTAMVTTGLIASTLSILGALALFLVASLATLWLSVLARKWIGGYTGDVLGATAIVTELVVLTGTTLTHFAGLPF